MRGPGASGSLHMLFKSRVFIPCHPELLLNISAVGFQSQTFWGLFSLLQDPKVVVPGVGINPLLLGEKLRLFVCLLLDLLIDFIKISFNCGSPYWEWGFW